MARILVVDDEEGIRRVLHQLFEYEDHEVRSAGGGAEAIAIHQEFHPDVTFLDVKMARMDGLEALSRIRENDPAAVVRFADRMRTEASRTESSHACVGSKP